MKKINNILLYVILAISAFMTIYYFFFGGTEFTRVGNLLIWAYILLGLGVLLLILVPFLNIGANPSSLKKGGISVAFIVVLFALSYFLSTDAHTVSTQAMLEPPSSTTLKIIDTGLLATYLLLVASVVAILFGAVYISIKKR